MIDIDDLPDWCRELILTDATVRFLYDDHCDAKAETVDFYNSLAQLLNARARESSREFR